MKDKKSFVMMEDWTVLLSKLPEQEAGRLIKAICTYQLTGELDESDPIVVAWMSVITPIMDENNEKHEETCQKRAEAGKNGAAKRWKADSKPMANDSNCYPDDSKRIANDSKPMANTWQTMPESESDSVSESENPTGLTIPPTPLSGADLSEPVKDKLTEWLAYKRERRESYKPLGMKSLITQVRKQEKQLGALAVIDAIDTSMANGWKGIIWERARSGTKTQSLDDYMLGVINGGTT